MGTSHPETKPWVIDRILEAGCSRVLDVGAGAGNWLDHLREAGYSGQAHAVEVWAPYVEQYGLRERYDHVWMNDVRALSTEFFINYDAVIFGDVLEHMTSEEAVTVWANARLAKHAAIAIPIGHYPQGALSGNPFEVHVTEDWTHEQVLDTFYGITLYWMGNVTAAYWR